MVANFSPATLNQLTDQVQPQPGATGQIGTESLEQAEKPADLCRFNTHTIVLDRQ